MISMLGVIIGVMTLNIVLAVMTGFEEDLRDRILGFNPQVVVLSFGGTIARLRRASCERIDAVPGVVAAAPFVYGQVMLVGARRTSPARWCAASRPTPRQVIDLQRHLHAGQRRRARATLHAVPLDDGQRRDRRAAGLILGNELARQLGVQVGDAVNVISPIGDADRGRHGAAHQALRGRRALRLRHVRVRRVAGLHGPRRRAALLRAGRRASPASRCGSPTSTRPRRSARGSAQALGFPYRVRDWMEINHNLFSALQLEKTVYFIVLLLIVLVAAFNIVATLIMVVMEKRKDIAILKSMGATRAGVGAHLRLQGHGHRRRRHAARQRRRLSARCWLLQALPVHRAAEGRLLRRHRAGAHVPAVLRRRHRRRRC